MALIKGIPGKGTVLKEYGQNIQKIVDWILTIEDKEQRTRYAYICIELMRQLNPSIKDAQEHTEKLWDHLFIMSQFKLDVDSPYPMPDPSILGRKPLPVPYNQNNLRFKHYGKNIELLIEAAKQKTDPEEKEAAIVYIIRLMKKYYITWNKDTVEDEVILEHLHILSKGQLNLSIERVKEGRLLEQINMSEQKLVPNSFQGGRSNNSNNRQRKTSSKFSSNNKFKRH